MTPADPIDEVTAAVLATAKYATVCPDTVHALATVELRTTPSTREAIKRVKRKLHQIGGAYQAGRMPYARWLAELRTAPDRAALLAVAQRVMAAHASSRERLPNLDEFYEHVLAPLGPIERMLDLACGLNPLAIPWMGLAPTTRYDCIDIYSDQMAFLQEWLHLIGQPGLATCQDALLTPPSGAYDVILLLKTVPCLQQIDAPATERLLGALQARQLVVSFPAYSLGGRSVGMVTNYSRGFEALLTRLGLSGRSQLIGDELVYIINCRSPESPEHPAQPSRKDT